MVSLLSILLAKGINFVKSVYFPAFALGALFTLTFAPFSLLPMALISLYGLLHILDKAQTKKEAFKIGWVFGFGHYITSLYWFSYALLTDTEKFGWMIPFAILLIPAVLGVYTGLVTLFTFHFPKGKFRRELAFAVAWVVVEVLRTYFIIPFPWNLLGHALIADISMAQVTYYIGIFGGSFLIAFTAAIFYQKKHFHIFLIFIIWICITFFGYSRVQFKPSDHYQYYMIRLVQPFNLHHFGDEAVRESSIKRLTELSMLNRPQNLKYVIWPEAAFPYGPYLESRFKEPLSRIIPQEGSLIFGSDRFVFSEDKKKIKEVYNSIFAINSDAKIVDVYDKSILVPFGEYVPFRAVLPNIPKVTDGIHDFSTGNQSDYLFNVFRLPRFRGMICYEAIFPEIEINKDAQWILNLTNDAWYGESIGPYQHFAMAHIKAIETGLPLVRVANNGITAVIDGYGEIKGKLELGDVGYLDFNLPKKVDTINHTVFKWLFKAGIFLLFFFLISFEIYVKNNYHTKLKKWVLK